MGSISSRAFFRLCRECSHLGITVGFVGMMGYMRFLLSVLRAMIPRATIMDCGRISSNGTPSPVGLIRTQCKSTELLSLEVSNLKFVRRQDWDSPNLPLLLTLCPEM